MDQGMSLDEAIARFNAVGRAMEATYKDVQRYERLGKLKHKRPKLRKSTRIKYNPRVSSKTLHGLRTYLMGRP